MEARQECRWAFFSLSWTRWPCKNTCLHQFVAAVPALGPVGLHVGCDSYVCRIHYKSLVICCKFSRKEFQQSRAVCIITGLLYPPLPPQFLANLYWLHQHVYCPQRLCCGSCTLKNVPTQFFFVFGNMMAMVMGAQRFLLSIFFYHWHLCFEVVLHQMCFSTFTYIWITTCFTNQP